MGQRCRPQSLGEVQRCNPLCFLLTAAQHCCSWASLTDHLVRKFKDSLGINMTMKKIFIFVLVQTMKVFFIFVVSSGHAKPHAQLQIARHLELDYENFLTNVRGPRP